MMIHKWGALSLIGLMCLAVPTTLSAHGLHAGSVTNVFHAALHLLELATVVIAVAWVARTLMGRVTGFRHR